LSKVTAISLVFLISDLMIDSVECSWDSSLLNIKFIGDRIGCVLLGMLLIAVITLRDFSPGFLIDLCNV
jgi:hypothetical protein